MYIENYTTTSVAIALSMNRPCQAKTCLKIVIIVKPSFGMTIFNKGLQDLFCLPWPLWTDEV